MASSDPLEGFPPPPPPPPMSSLPPAPEQTAGGFDMNRPTIISILYLAGWLTGGVTGIVALVLCYVWKGEPHEPWEDSHYQYLANTFWLALVGTIVGAILTLVLIGIFILFGVAIAVTVRAAMAMMKAQRKEPMPNPNTLLF